MFQTKVVENPKHTFYVRFFFFYLAVYDLMWKNTVDLDRQQVAKLWCMRVACWIPNVTNTISQYVILIAFPLQHGLTKDSQC